MNTNDATHLAGRPADRVAAVDWPALAEELDEHGSAPTGPLLTAQECRAIAALYDEGEHFRTTVDMARHRFGSGQYRYFTHELPEVVAEPRAAFYPRLLPVAREWAARLGRPAPWPDTPGEWLRMCHDAGQAKSAQILLRYGRTRLHHVRPAGALPARLVGGAHAARGEHGPLRATAHDGARLPRRAVRTASPTPGPAIRPPITSCVPPPRACRS